MSLALLFHHLLLSMFRMLVYLVLVYFSGSMCVGVTVWFGWVVWYRYAG
jgi:hypothetical protein